MYEKAKNFLDEHTYEAVNLEEMKKLANEKIGFIKASWCGNNECEEKIKDDSGYKSRCILIDEKTDGVCAVCGGHGL